MKVIKVTSDDGSTIEKFTGNSIIVTNGSDGCTFKLGPINTIRENATVTRPFGNINRVIGDPNKTAYWYNIEVVYDDKSTSTLAYVDAVAIDALRFNPTNDFVYFGIPIQIANRIMDCARNQVGISDNTAYLDRNTSDGYVWSSTKIDDKHLDGCFCYADRGRVRMAISHLCEEYKKEKRNVLCHALIQLKLKAYVPKTTLEADVIKHPWTIGGTLVQLTGYGDTLARSPGSLTKQAIDARPKRPKGTNVSDLCNRIASVFLVEDAVDAPDASTPPTTVK